MLDNNPTANGTLEFDVATVVFKGARPYQEDALFANFPMAQGFGYAVISDGLGGHQAGHVASALVTSAFFSRLKMLETELESGTLNIPAALREAAISANEKVGEHARADSTTRGMGCTVLAPVVRGDRLYWISVGDSILLLFRGGALRRLNKDHSMAPQIDLMAASGSMDAETARTHPDRNVLASVIDGTPIEMIDCPTSSIKLAAGDVLIAASDGIQSLSNVMLANTLMKTANRGAAEIAAALLEAVKSQNDPEQDNASFAVVKLVQEENDVVVDADDLPVLAMAEPSDADVSSVATDSAEEPVKDEKKAYWYRGQKYYRD